MERLSLARGQVDAPGNSAFTDVSQQSAGQAGRALQGQGALNHCRENKKPNP
jgi:hypothetical protein